MSRPMQCGGAVTRLAPWVAALISLAGASHASAQQAPKVGVMVAGDPEPSIRTLAQQIDARGRARVSLRWPSDPGIPPALRGEPGPSEDDGLGTVRALRRRVGWDADEDARILRRLGRGVGVTALAVLRATEHGASLEVFDVGAGRFYEQTLPLETAPMNRQQIDAALEFIRRRAEATRRRVNAANDVTQATAADMATASGAADAEQLPGQRETAAARAAPAPSSSAVRATGTREEDRPARAWLRHNWAYVVGGALLAAIGLGYAISASRTGGGGNGSPSLRFRPGG